LDLYVAIGAVLRRKSVGLRGDKKAFFEAFISPNIWIVITMI
jgi:hypothetical protein